MIVTEISWRSYWGRDLDRVVEAKVGSLIARSLERLRQMKSQTLLCGKSCFFLSCSICRRRAAGRTLAAVGQGANHRATGSAANKSKTALPEAASADEHAVGHQRQFLPVQRDRDQGQAQISSLMQVSGITYRNHLSGHGNTRRGDRLVVHREGLIQHR